MWWECCVRLCPVVIGTEKDVGEGGSRKRSNFYLNHLNCLLQTKRVLLGVYYEYGTG